jgi:hypothetical protein
MTDRLVSLMRTRAQTRFGDAERWTEYMKPLAFGRAAKPEEIGWMAAFLASDLSAYTTDHHDRRRRLEPPLGALTALTLAGASGFGGQQRERAQSPTEPGMRVPERGLWRQTARAFHRRFHR